MEVKDKVLYHFHKKGIHDNEWYVGSEFTIDNEFNTDLLDILNNFNTAVNTTDEDRISFDQIINNYLNEKASKKELERMLRECIIIIKNTNLFTQEIALEEVRKTLFNQYPSRRHCIFLLDKDNIKYWHKELNKDNEIELYKVLVTGNLFKFDVKNLPDGNLTYAENIVMANKYWNSENKDSENTEYLFQGKLKIIKKVNYRIEKNSGIF